MTTNLKKIPPNRKLDGKEDVENDEQNEIVVTVLKLLWTFTIRDVISILIFDQLVETMNFMAVQLKLDSSIDDRKGALKETTSDTGDSYHTLTKLVDDGQQEVPYSEAKQKSALMSLLKCGVESSEKLIGFETPSNNDHSDENIHEKSDTKMIPIIDIHL